MEDQRQFENRTMPESKSKVKEAASEVQRKAEDVAEEVKHQAKAGIHRVEQQAQTSLSAQKEEVVHKLHGVTEALRLTRDQLQEQDQNSFAQYSDKMADQIERFSTYLEEHDLEELRHSAENFARRQPELFLGGAFALGLLAARFLKSSTPTQPRQTALAYRPANSMRPYSSTNSMRPYSRMPEATTRPYTSAVRSDPWEE
jgi:hypothetical protein